MRQVMEPLTNAIKNNDIDNFKDIFLKLPKKFVVRDSNDIFILYEESMNKNRKEIFDFLLAFHGKDDVGTIAALNYVLNDQNSVPDYYVNELLKKYSSVRNDENILVISSRGKCVEATKFFVDRGLDVNAQTMNDCTPLQRVLVLEPDINTEELIITLLFYGADPSVETERGYNCFELAVQHNHANFIQEMLFDSIFDNHGHYKLHISILLQLAQLESPLFHQLLKYDVEFVLDADFQTVRDLLLLDIEYFKIILQNYEKLCCEIFDNHVLYYSTVQHIHYCSFSTKNVPDIATVFCMDQILTKFDFLLQGTDTLKKSVVDFINTLHSLLFFRYCHGSKSEAEITEIFAYLLTYGLSVRKILFEVVYGSYGYCELFKLLLYMDVEPGGQNFQDALVSFICDINFTLDTFSPEKYTVHSLLELTNYFVHPKVREVLLKKAAKNNLATMENYPQLPSLVEIARNSFRKYFLTKFNVKSAKQFYTLVNKLPISVVYKKIVSLETKLYNY